MPFSDSMPQPTAPDTRVPAERSSTAAFFVLAFALTWGLQLPAVLAQRGVLPGNAGSYMPFAFLGILGPLLAATWLTGRRHGRAGIGALFRPLFAWRVSVWWYAVALLLPAALLSGGLGALSLAGRSGDVVLLPDLGRLLVVPLIAIGEEVGWRGYALPRLQRRHGPLVATGILGTLWTVWHIPMFLAMGIPLSLLLVMLLFFVGGSLMFTWIYNRTGGSLLLMVLAHAGAHLNNSHLALPADTLPLVVHAIVYGLIGVGAMYLDRTAFGLEPLRLRRTARRHLAP